MICPYCRKKISDSAIRCKYCRKTPKGNVWSLKNILVIVWRKLFIFGKDKKSCPWSLWDVFLIIGFILLFIFRDPFQMGSRIINFLRLHFFIFTKEPKLYYYLAIYINTIIFKFVALALMVLFVRFRKVSFWNKVINKGKLPHSWLKWLLVYAAICCVFRFIGMRNPLIPNIPLDSVFIEAKIIGNIVIVFSILFVAPFVEEALFRGFIYPTINKYIGTYASIFFTSLLFTLAHYPHIKNDYIFMMLIFCLGIMMTYAKAKTGSTWIAILMHHIYNLVYVIIGFGIYIVAGY